MGRITAIDDGAVWLMIVNAAGPVPILNRKNEELRGRYLWYLPLPVEGRALSVAAGALGQRSPGDHARLHDFGANIKALRRDSER